MGELPTRFERAAPVLPVRDLGRALAHYARLGFTTTPYPGGGYGFASRDGVELHLAEHGDRQPGAEGVEGVEAYLYVEDADALYERWAAPGIGGRTRRVADTPYELREGSHVDLDGNLLRFGSPMPHRGAERIGAHLAARYGIAVAETEELDLQVFHVRRRDGRDWVARRFPARRTSASADGDAAVLRVLAEHGFPAERCAADEPVSELDGRRVLVTEWVETVGRAERRDVIRTAGGIAALGALLGRLSVLDPAGISRPGGAWHHLADGTPAAELAAAAELLDAVSPLVGGEGAADLAAMRATVADADPADSLPAALVHPDFVLANVVASPEGMVLVDWTGAGIGPRLWPLAFLLYAEGAKDLRRVDPVVAGYRRHVTPEPEELGRLASVMRARPLVLLAWAVATGRTTLPAALGQVAELDRRVSAIAERALGAFARPS